MVLFYGANLTKVYGSSSISKSGSATYSLELSSTEIDPTHNWVLTAKPIGSQAKTGAVTIDSTGRQCWFKGKDSPVTTILVRLGPITSNSNLWINRLFTFNQNKNNVKYCPL